MDIVEFLLKGVLIGFALAAPVGPSGVLCLRRTLLEGRVAGLATGVGAATATAAYAAIAGFSLIAVSDVLIESRPWLTAGGGLFLCFLGLRTMLVRPGSRPMRLVQTGLAASYLSGLRQALRNPVAIMSYAAVFAGVGLIEQDASQSQAAAMVAGVFAGSMVWWALLSSFAAQWRRRYPAARSIGRGDYGGAMLTGMSLGLGGKRLRNVSRVSGAILLAFGTWALYKTVPWPADASRVVTRSPVLTERFLPGHGAAPLGELVPPADHDAEAADPVEDGGLPAGDFGTGQEVAREAADRVYQRSQTRGLDAAACANEDVVSMVAEAEPGTRLWKWIIAFLHRCAKVQPSQSELFERLVHLRPDNEEIIHLNITAALMNSEHARVVWAMTAAIDRSTSSETLTSLASMGLGIGQVMSNDESLEDLVRQAYVNVETASVKAMKLDSSLASNSASLLVLAQAQTALGKFEDALRTAERAALQVDVSAPSAAREYFGIGEVIYRGGQRETGVAYMEQGIQLMSGNDAAHHRELVDDLIAGRR